MRIKTGLTLLCALLVTAAAASNRKRGTKSAASDSSLDRYLAEIDSRPAGAGDLASPGSLYSPNGRLGDAFRDLRASQLDDLVTILVSDRASAIASGTTNTARKSSVKAGVTALAGPLKAGGILPNLATTNGEQQLQGQGTTSRDSTLTTTLSARVVRVLPNGNLVVEGAKEILVNSERQLVSVRGILRPLDLSSANTIPSDRLAGLEVRVNGKGVVGDSVRRPFILYRILMGLLPI
jgi:flagellar L-ring protein precursor FlgH